MRWTTRLTTALFACTLLVAGCSNDSSGGGGGGQDTFEDTGRAVDTATDRDTGPDRDTVTGRDTAPDTGTERDSGPADSGTEDTGTEDTATADSGIEDSGIEDTGPVDTGIEETGVVDTGFDAGDTGGVDVDTAIDVATDTAGRDVDASDGGDTLQIPDVDVGPGGEYSIRQIRTLSVNLGPSQSLPGSYRIEDVVVTAIRGNLGVYVQEPSGPKANSGLWIFFNDAQSGVSIPSNIQRGTLLNLEGTVTNYDDNNSGTNGGLLQLHQLSTIAIQSQSGTVPSAVQITDPADIGTYAGTTGSRAESLESVLVEVHSVHVIDANPDSPQDFNEFVVGGSSGASDGVRVDDLLYKYGSMPRQLDPSAGDQFGTIKGPLHFSYDHMKIVPREASDLQ